MIDRLIDPRLGEFHLQHRRGWCQAAAHDGRGHADRAEIVRMAVRRVVAVLTAIGAGDGGNQHAGALGRLAAEGVNVTEGERQIDDERD